MKKLCDVCNGKGEIEDASETNSQTKNDGEQNRIQDTQDSTRQANVDPGTPEDGKGKRQIRRKRRAVGIGESHLPEREESGQSDEASGHSQDESQQSSSEV